MLGEEKLCLGRNMQIKGEEEEKFASSGFLIAKIIQKKNIIYFLSLYVQLMSIRINVTCGGR